MEIGTVPLHSDVNGRYVMSAILKYTEIGLRQIILLYRRKTLQEALNFEYS